MSRERMVIADTVVDKKRRNSGSSDLLLVSVLSFLLHNLESSMSFAILFLLFKYHLHDKRRNFKPCRTTIPPSP